MHFKDHINIMRLSTLVDFPLKIFILFVYCAFLECSANERNIQQPHARRIMDTDNSAYFEKVSMDYMLSKLAVWQNDYKHILISLDLNEPNRTTNFTIDCLAQVALHNKHDHAPWELWLSITPRNSISSHLDFIRNLVMSINQISNRTITTVLLDYGLLQLTPVSSPLVQEDLDVCRRKVIPLNLRCGIVVDSINCLTSIDHITKLGLKPGDIFLVSDDYFTYYRSGGLLYNVFPCLWSLKGTNVSLGYEIDVLHHDEVYEDPENYDDHEGALHERKKRSNLKDGDGSLQIDYVIVHLQAALAERHTQRRFNPLQNIEEWLSRPAEFDGKLFGASFYLHAGNKFLWHDESAIVIMFQQFSKVLLEMDDVKDGAQIVRQIAHAARQTPDFAPEVGLVMNIWFDDFALNKQNLENFLSVAAAGNEAFSDSTKLILFNWAVLHIVSNNSVSAKHLNESRGDVYLSQAKAMYQVLEHVKAQNITDVRFGLLWETGVIDGLINLEDAETAFKYIGLHPLYVDTIILKIVITLEALVWEDLLFLSRTVIYSLTYYVDLIRGTPSNTPVPINVGAYIGILGCTGGPYTNASELTEYLLFWEIIQTWAVSQNVSVYINTAFETDQMPETKEDCQATYFKTGRAPCMCGWWHVSNTSTVSPDGAIQDRTIENKKSIARRLFVQANAPKIQQPTGSTRGNNWRSMTRLGSIVASAVLFCVLMGSFTVYMVRHYRSKDLISQREVQRFLLGTREISSSQGENEGSVNAHGRGYDMERYEILPSSFSIDLDYHLGQGEYGRVYKGTISRDGTTTEVAVKMKGGQYSIGSQRHDDVLALRAIISEIKILSYVGEHPNIVKLEGAYTAKLRKGIVMVFLELCPLGSLDKRLRTYNPEVMESSQLMDNTIETSAVNATVVRGSSRNINIENAMLPGELGIDLGKWAHEIATGMEFLTAKKLVHADLATRNVLLDANKRAKISDFGLSRRLYNYKEYLKREEASLPWRWMAPESLRKLVFNEKTDVWAFGVTLWEMYTLGDLPYPGLSYHINFPALLSTPTVIGGVRLEKPRYSSDKMYQVMQRCWEICPSERPTFSDLLAMLQNFNLNI